MTSDKQDIDLIKSIKENKDSASLTELVSRHTGIYATIVNQYAGYSSAINKNDLLDERLFNIYTYACDYKPEFKMKFSTYVGERVKYACKTLLSQNVIDNVDINNSIPDGSNFIKEEEAHDDIEEIMKNTESKKDKLFRRIMKMRSEDKKVTWMKIGKTVGVSHEWARKLYYKRLKELKKKVLS